MDLGRPHAITPVAWVAWAPRVPPQQGGAHCRSLRCAVTLTFCMCDPSWIPLSLLCCNCWLHSVRIPFWFHAIASALVVVVAKPVASSTGICDPLPTTFEY
jgi:hypothetical protein